MSTYSSYNSLKKPKWAPPANVFGPVWTFLYIVIVISYSYTGYLAASGTIPALVTLPFVLNIIFNVVFVPIQFGLKNLWLAALDVVLVLVTLVWAMVAIYPRITLNTFLSKSSESSSSWHADIYAILKDLNLRSARKKKEESTMNMISRRTQRLLGFLAALTAACCLATTASAGTGVTNGGFETGDLTGWQSTGIASIETSNFGIDPSQGTYQALLQSQNTFSAGVSEAELDTFLNLPAGSLTALGNGTVVQGSAMQQTFTANAGDTLSLAYNFLTNENPGSSSTNDFAFVSISPGTTLTLANTYSSLTAAPFTTFAAETGYQAFWYQVPVSGTYTLGIGVTDVGDQFNGSGLLVDNVSLRPASAGGSSVPLPPAVIVGALMMLATCFLAVHFRSKRLN